MLPMLRILPVGGVLLAIMQAAIRRRGTEPVARAAGYAGPRRRRAGAPKVAGLPTERNDTDLEADDETGSIVQPPPATIPIDIGETSSTELPGAGRKNIRR
jgi:hypothetical protein